MRILLVIDPQNDFIDTPGQPGSLAVPGSFEDMQRLAAHILRTPPDAVALTQDSHRVIDIGHPGWWQNSAGEAPAPFTLISVGDIERGLWMARESDERAHSADYVRRLGASMVWPVHCVLGTPGWAISETLMSAVRASAVPEVHTFLKGLNPRTEHYSAIQADVVDRNDPRTGPNQALLDTLERFDRIEIAGEALSHCVNRTVRDIVALRPHLAERIVLLRDAMSAVPGFEAEGAAFLDDMAKAGCRIGTCEGDELRKDFSENKHSGRLRA